MHEQFDQPSKIVRAVIIWTLILCAGYVATLLIVLLAAKSVSGSATGHGCLVQRQAGCVPAAIERPTGGREVMRDGSQALSGTVAGGNVAAPRPSTSNTAGATLLAYGSDEISTRRRTHRSHWARPHRWCGWYMRQLMGVSDPRFNLARNWARYGRPAYGPAPGVIVVWRGHVGKIVGPCHGSMCMVHSGNDGRAVRTRLRSVARAIAFRWPA